MEPFLTSISAPCVSRRIHAFPSSQVSVFCRFRTRASIISTNRWLPTAKLSVHLACRLSSSLAIRLRPVAVLVAAVRHLRNVIPQQRSRPILPVKEGLRAERFRVRKAQCDPRVSRADFRLPGGGVLVAVRSWSCCCASVAKVRARNERFSDLIPRSVMPFERCARTSARPLPMLWSMPPT